jgi:hypothetical protein
VTDVNGKGEKRSLAKQMQDFVEYFREWRHAKVLFTTSATWFLLYVSSDACFVHVELLTVVLVQWHCLLWPKPQPKHHPQGDRLRDGARSMDEIVEHGRGEYCRTVCCKYLFHRAVLSIRVKTRSRTIC